MRLPAAVLVIAMLTAGIQTAPESAAETVHKRDRSRDMRYAERGSSPHAVRRADGDILRYRFTYTNKRFSAVVHLRALRRNVPARYLSVNLRYEGDVQLEYIEAEVNARPTNPQGRAKLTGGPVRCRNVDHRLDYRHDQFRISFPARCIQSARSVRASVVSAVSDRPLRRATYVYIDAAPRLGDAEGDGVRVRRGQR